MSRLIPHKTTIRLPAAARTSLEQLAEGLRDQGLSVRQVGPDHLEVHQPPSIDASPFTAQRWLSGSLMTIRRSDIGITMSPRIPVLRVAASSVFLGIVSSGLLATASVARLWVGVGVALMSVLIQLSAPRHGAVMVFEDETSTPVTTTQP